MAPRKVQVRRVYDPPAADDGIRVLVDRVWPRGVRKDELAMDAWVKNVAPSTELRRWFGHEQERFAEFRRRYQAELDQGIANTALDELRKTADGSTLTLLTATRDVEHSHAAVLSDLLRPPDPGTEGGDPACWLAGVCPECGRFVADEPPTTCPQCGAHIAVP